MENQQSFLEVSEETIQSKIYLIRGRKVMLDSDLAKLYGVSTGALVQAVKRNLQRFQEDFMQVIERKELRSLISQNVISKLGRGGRTSLPLAFTEQGVSMLSSVLKSERAIRINIQIIRTFTKLRQMLEAYKELRQMVQEMEKKYDHQFKIVFDALRQLLEKPEKNKKPIGFHVEAGVPS